MQNNSLQLYVDVCNQILNHEFVKIHVEINLTLQTCVPLMLVNTLHLKLCFVKLK